jgi:L-threonylcarbamoyladenylate synthase
VDRLFSVKGRDITSAIPLIAASLAQAELVAVFGDLERRLAHAFWPGPLAIVAPARDSVSRRVLAGGTTVAVRVPAHPVAAALADAFGFCVTATSANLSGAPATADPAVVARTLGGRIDLLMDAGTAPGGPPSTIVEVRDGRPVLVREGAVAWNRVLISLQ